jgi:hypothetical protein
VTFFIDTIAIKPIRFSGVTPRQHRARFSLSVLY